jgi:tetratricopeptide (TPR) repeat protein
MESQNHPKTESPTRSRIGTMAKNAVLPRSRHSLAQLDRVTAFVLSIALLAGIAAAIVAVTRRTIARWYFDRAQTAADAVQQEALLRRAIAWDAANPRYAAALARVRQFTFSLADPAEVVRLYEQAAALAPHRPEMWIELGAAAEWAGDLHRARNAFERAHALAPHAPRTNWQLGNFYLRASGQQSNSAAEREELYLKSLRALREAIFTEPKLRRPAFELAWRVVESRAAQAAPGTDPRASFLRELLPDEPNIAIEFLSFLVERSELDAAAQVWRHLLDIRQPFAPAATFFYFDALIRARRSSELAAAWQTLRLRFPGEIPASDPENLLYNADFVQPALGGGLDWRFPPAEGARAEIVPADPAAPFAQRSPGARMLQVTFEGTHNTDFSQAYQFVPLTPGRHYRFRGCVKTEGVTSDSGVRLEILDAYDSTALFLHSPALTGTAPWQCSELAFRSGPATSLAVIRVARPRSRKLSGLISGRVWIGGLRLTADPARAPVRESAR